MENPGLKRHISDAPLLKVTYRRTANPIMPAPKTLGTDGYQDSINDLYNTQREDVETPPPLAGGSGTDMVPATNGEQTPRRPTDMGSYRAGVSETMVPGETSQVRPTQSVDDPNDLADERRKSIQQQVGGGEKENPAYDQAQERIRQKMQVRRAHPLHQAESDEEFWDRQPDVISHRRRFADGEPVVASEDPPCETCYLNHEMENVPEWLHDEYGGVPAHPFKPLVMTPGQRFSRNQTKTAELRPHGGDEEHGLIYTRDTDFSPTDSETRTRQPMFKLKRTNDEEYQRAQDEGYDYFDNDSGVHEVESQNPTCETCYLKYGDRDAYPEDHQLREGHRFKPLVMEPGQRFSSWDMLHERPEDFDLPEFYRQQGLDVHISPYGNGLAHFFDPSNTRDVGGIRAPRSNPSSRQMISVQPDWYIRHDPSDDTADSEDDIEDERWRGDRFDPETEPCADCWVNDGSIVSKTNHRVADHPWRGAGPTELSRFGAQVPSDDPVYPYSGRVDPEDATDMENMQSGDDTFRPHHPDVDRVMNQLQGLPDMTRNDPRLMDKVNEILDTAPDTEEGNRGADALSMGLNTIFDSTNETKGLPREERLQRAKDAMDAHFETAQLTHKQHVKQLHDDWLARGGHKTGEPRPVERFSPRFTKPQQIVPDPSNPFSELESPILYAGKCEGCGKKLYDSADSSGDPRGALGDHTVGTIDAAEYSPRGDNGERRMHGPSALICPGCDNESERRNAIEDKYMGHKAGDKTGDGYWGVPWGSPAGTKREFIPTTYGKDRKGKWHEPGEKVGSCPECDKGITGFHRRQASGSVQWDQFLREASSDESDEEFWARMESEHPGEQATGWVQPGMTSPDSASYAHVDPDDEGDWEDESFPQRMSLRDHARLMNSGRFQWDGDYQYPKYTHIIPREITTADGEEAHANEGHVIEHNTNHHGPVLPTEDYPDPHPLEYQWTHSYYPASHTDDQGFVKGYNSLDRAIDSANKLSVYGPHHSNSAGVLDGYERIHDSAPYTPDMIDQSYGRSSRLTQREGAFDPDRGEFLYDIDHPGYYKFDKPPSSEGHSHQPMYQMKSIPYEDDEDVPGDDLPERMYSFDAPMEHSNYPFCQRCWAMGKKFSGWPEDSVHQVGSSAYHHDYKPIDELPPGQRLAAAPDDWEDQFKALTEGSGVSKSWADEASAHDEAEHARQFGPPDRHVTVEMREPGMWDTDGNYSPTKEMGKKHQIPWYDYPPHCNHQSTMCPECLMSGWSNDYDIDNLPPDQHHKVYLDDDESDWRGEE